MIDPRFVFVGAALSLLGGLVYARATIAGRTQPNRVTWFVWALAPCIGFAAQVADGVGVVAVTTLSVGLGPLIVFCSSFVNPAAYWRIGRFDVACGALALCALAGWAITGEGVVAVALSVTADALAAVPTLVKAWRAPETENGAPYRNAAINGTIALLALQRWSVAAVLFPIYLVVMGLVLWGAVTRGRPARGRRGGRPGRRPARPARP